MIDLNMRGRSAIVTGAAGGIGREVALALSKQGCDVVLTDLPGTELEQVAEEARKLGVQATMVSGDIRSLSDVQAVVDCAEEQLGGVDYYISVAGGGTAQSLSSMSSDDWDSVVGLNLTGPFNGIKAVSPALRRRGGGAIVVVGSLASLTMSMNNGVSYTAAKAGVLGLVRHSAFELARDNIHVNAVLPGPVLSPQMTAKLPPEIIQRVADTLPRGRWVEPEEIANAVLFFCSSLSSGTIGAHVVVDSGLHIGAPSSHEEYFSRRDSRGGSASAAANENAPKLLLEQENPK